jgi:hypothetical protein
LETSSIQSQISKLAFTAAFTAATILNSGKQAQANDSQSLFAKYHEMINSFGSSEMLVDCDPLGMYKISKSLLGSVNVVRARPSGWVKQKGSKVEGFRVYLKAESTSRKIKVSDIGLSKSGRKITEEIDLPSNVPERDGKSRSYPAQKKTDGLQEETTEFNIDDFEFVREPFTAEASYQTALVLDLTNGFISREDSEYSTIIYAIRGEWKYKATKYKYKVRGIVGRNDLAECELLGQ